jgi:translation elongation factor EF-Tu-like GTPase
MSRDKERGNPSYRRSRKQEKEIAGRLGGRRTVASGSKDEKGDVRLKRVVRVEAKTTKNKSFSVTLDMIRQIEDAALAADEMPVIAIEFNDGRGKKVKEVAVVPMYVLDLIRSR